MSAKYTFLAWDTPIDNAPLKLALLQLANNADDDGFSYYSISKMALSCGMSDRTFMRKISELEKMDVLTVERRPNRPSLYTLIGDEMGVSLCHLQEVEVTESHAEVTESHLVGDSVSHDLNSTPNINPKSTSSPRIDYKLIMSHYNKKMPHKPIKKMTDTRKALVKKVMSKSGADIETLLAFIDHVAESPEWKWTRESNVGKNGVNYHPKTFDYYMTEDNLIKAMED